MKRAGSHTPFPWMRGGPRTDAEALVYELQKIDAGRERRRFYANELDDDGEPDHVLVATFERREDAELLERLLADRVSDMATLAEVVSVVLAGIQSGEGVGPNSGEWATKARETLDRLGLLPASFKQ